MAVPICSQTFWQSYSTKLFIATFLVGTQAAGRWTPPDPCADPNEYNNLLMPYYRLAPFPYELPDDVPSATGDIQQYRSRIQYDLMHAPEPPPPEEETQGRIHYDYDTMNKKLRL